MDGERETPKKNETKARTSVSKGCSTRKQQVKNKTISTTEDVFNAGAIILETAHPVKFPEVVEEAIGQALSIPASVQNLFEKEKVSIPLAPNYTAFKNWMINK